MLLFDSQMLGGYPVWPPERPGAGAAKACGFPGEVKCKVGEGRAMAGAIAHEQRFQERRKLASILRARVHFYDRSTKYNSMITLYMHSRKDNKRPHKCPLKGPQAGMQPSSYKKSYAAPGVGIGAGAISRKCQSTPRFEANPFVLIGVN
jgi:hypothetical protein